MFQCFVIVGYFFIVMVCLVGHIVFRRQVILNFTAELLGFLFYVVYVDELDLELVLKVLQFRQVFPGEWPGGRLLELLVELVQFVAVRMQLLNPLTAFPGKL